MICRPVYDRVETRPWLLWLGRCYDCGIVLWDLRNTNGERLSRAQEERYWFSPRHRDQFRAEYLNYWQGAETYLSMNQIRQPPKPTPGDEVTTDDIKAVCRSLHDDDAQVVFDKEGGFRYVARRERTPPVP